MDSRGQSETYFYGVCATERASSLTKVSFFKQGGNSDSFRPVAFGAFFILQINLKYLSP